MTRRLNIICILIFFTLAASLSVNIMGGIDAVREALAISHNEELINSNNDGISSEYITIKLYPKDPGNYNDSIFNTKTDVWTPMQYSEITTRVENNPGITRITITLILSLSYIAAAIIAFICFIILIININKSYIFEWKNVRLLRRIGIALITTSLIVIILGYLNYHTVSSQIQLKDYDFDYSNILQTGNLMLGLASLLIAEIFAIGLKLREEQELTI